MTDADDTDGDDVQSSTDVDPLAVNSAYKVLGEFTDTSGAGVLGQNNADTGTPIGVQGAASNGYGLATPHDAKVDGVAELAALAGALTDGTEVTSLAGEGLSLADNAVTLPTLPDFDAIGEDPETTIAALQREFNKPAWGNLSYASGPNGSSSSFRGAVLAPTGDVVLVPRDADNVALYDPTTDSYTAADTHGEGDSAFAGGALLPSGEIAFVPSGSSNVGVFDPEAETYRSGPSHGVTSGGAFSGGVVTVDSFSGSSGVVVFAPASSDHVGLYYRDTDTSGETYIEGPTHGQTTPAFGGAALAPTEEVIFAPDASDNVGIYDPDTAGYTSGPTHGEGDSAFSDAVLAPTGDVIFVPKNASNVGIYDPVDGTYTTGTSLSVGDTAFLGGAVAPTGEVIFAPYSEDNIGVYDPVEDSFTLGPAHGEGSFAFDGAATAPNGDVILAPSFSDSTGNVETGVPIDLATALHPLVNNS